MCIDDEDEDEDDEEEEDEDDEEEDAPFRSLSLLLESLVRFSGKVELHRARASCRRRCCDDLL